MELPVNYNQISKPTLKIRRKILQNGEEKVNRCSKTIIKTVTLCFQKDKNEKLLEKRCKVPF